MVLYIFKQGGGAGSAGDTPAAVTAPHIERRHRTKLRPGQPCQPHHAQADMRRQVSQAYHKPITSRRGRRRAAKAFRTGRASPPAG